MSIPMIAGLYQYVRDGIASPPKVTLDEIPNSLKINPSYRKELLILADNELSAESLTSQGLHVYRIFTDAPDDVRRDSAHKMKHFMCLWALREFGEFLWVDWDTVMLRHPDAEFWDFCRKHDTPKFIWINNYWATVNCGIYYANNKWLHAMEASFKTTVSEPNDELLWTNVLPLDIRERDEFWWEERIVNIWNEDDFQLIKSSTYFAHVRTLSWAEKLRARQKNIS